MSTKRNKRNNAKRKKNTKQQNNKNGIHPNNKNDKENKNINIDTNKTNDNTNNKDTNKSVVDSSTIKSNSDTKSLQKENINSTNIKNSQQNTTMQKTNGFKDHDHREVNKNLDDENEAEDPKFEDDEEENEGKKTKSQQRRSIDTISTEDNVDDDYYEDNYDNEGDNGDYDDDPKFNELHPLANSWTFWWYNPLFSKQSWRDQLKQISDIKQVEEFWSVYNNVATPSETLERSDYNFFKTGIEPMWEDKMNENGGKWVVLFNPQDKKELDKCWLYTLLGCIGNGFGEHDDEICGAVVSLRRDGNKLALWTKTASDESLCKIIGKKWKTMMELKDDIPLGYQVHKEAINSSRSFGNAVKFEI